MADLLDDFLNAPAPAPKESAAPTPSPQAAPTPSAGGSDPLDAFLGSNGGAPAAQEVGSTPGSHPGMSIPESPLSPLERAAFGKVGQGKEGVSRQAAMLRENFGAKNVQMVKRDDDQMAFVVKDKDNQWKQVDPAGLSDVIGDGVGGLWDMVRMHPGDAMNRFGKAYETMKGLKPDQLVGGAAQEIGANGGKMVGAGLGAAQGAATGAALGPIGAFGGAVIGAGLGAAGAQTAEGAADAIYHKLDPSVNVGAVDPHDFAAQVGGAFLMGAEGEMTGKVLGMGAKATNSLLTGTIRRFAATPEGKAAAARILEVSGLDPVTARTKVEGPLETARYTDEAIKDIQNQTDNVYGRMKMAVTKSVNDMRAGLRSLGSEYNPLDAQAKQVTYDPATAKATSEAMQKLQTEGYLDGKGKIIQQDKNGFSRELPQVDQDALKQVQLQDATIRDRLAKGGKMAFDDYKRGINNVENYLSGEHPVTDQNLRRLLGEYRTNLKSEMHSGLPPELSKARAALDAKYGPAKELLESIVDKSAPDRIDSFLKQITRQDGTFNSELKTSLSNLLGTENPTDAILQMHAGRQIAKSPLISFKGNGWKQFVPGSPRLAAGAATAVGATKQAVRDFANPIGQGVSKAADSIPYMKQAAQTFAKIPPALQSGLVKNKAFVDGVITSVGTGVQAEQQYKQQLMDHAQQVVGAAAAPPQQGNGEQQ